MKKILDFYFRRPLFWDYLIVILVEILFHIYRLNFNSYVNYKNELISLISEISNISFTSTGFILTILTVLITFKANNSKKRKIEDYDSALSAFFETPLYKSTTKYLSDCIKSLLFVSIVGFLSKLILPNSHFVFLSYVIILNLTIVSLTLIRCLLILGKILKLQNK